MRLRMTLMVIVLILVLGALFGYRAFVNHMRDQFIANMKPPPVTVSTMKVKKYPWTPMLHSTGTLRAVHGVEVTSSIDGLVRDIKFESGATVQAGDLLVLLDSEVEQAQLVGLRAQLKLASQTLERKRKLRKRGLGSEADLDAAQAEYRNIKAQIAATQATIDKKHIEAPFSGQLGIRLVDLGQYIAPGTNIATLQALDQLFLDFDLPQQALAKIEVGQQVQLAIDTYPDQQFTGAITAISPQIDAATRTFRVRAKLQNPERLLRPGLFGKVTIALDTSRQVVAVPRTAISYNPYGDFVYVVTKASQPPAADTKATDGAAAAAPPKNGEAKLTAVRRNVHTGEIRGEFVQITSGLEPGDRIVIIGHHKLHPGATLNIDNSHVPEFEMDLEHVENY